MLREFDIVFMIFCAISGIVLLVANAITNRKVKNRINSTEEHINLDELIVIVPFRNEEKHLPLLIESINNQTKLPKKIYFVDDHSEDDSVNILTNLLEIDSYEILQLDDSAHGKKKALRKGIYHAKATYYLTLDADVFFASDYFENLQEIPAADMVVLPVLMEGRNFIGTLYSLDQLYVNAVSYSFSFKQVVTASGANLLFKREPFVLHDMPEMHYHVASGDDQFLLRDFKLADKDIMQIADAKYRVCTYSPATFKKFIHQRLRWAGKNSEVSSLSDNILAFIAVMLGVFFYTLCVVELISGNYLWALYVFLSKTVWDFVYYGIYFRKIGAPYATHIGVIITEFLYAPYIVCMIALIPFYKPQWKGRNLYSEKPNSDTKN